MWEQHSLLESQRRWWTPHQQGSTLWCGGSSYMPTKLEIESSVCGCRSKCFSTWPIPGLVVLPNALPSETRWTLSSLARNPERCRHWMQTTKTTKWYSLAECIEGLLFIWDSQPQCVDAVLRVGLPSPFHIDIVDETVMERRNNVLAAYDILPLKNTEKIKVKLVQYLTHGMTQIFEMSLLALGLANHGFQVGDDTKGLKNGGREEQLGVWIIQNYQAVKSGDWGKNLGIAKQRGMININQQPILRMRTRPTQQWVQYIARRTRRTRRIQYACIMYILDKSMTDGQSNLKIRWTEMSESPTK